MGNFQHLAQKVLSKNCPNAKVSCFLPLAEETGNFQGKSGNNAGNFNRSYNRESQSISAFKEETHKETSRKPEASNQETFAVKNHDKSFLISNSTAGILDGFFSNAAGLDINLLPDDKRWIKTVCFGISRPTLAGFLSEYIDRWHNAMERETVTYKKQNAGRRSANIWLRETLTNQCTS
ncbi:hypothetical protein [Legionella tucsonensis]|uniref:Uncharacterized protein n=1 Tax=Legionella tucsonensis TaxID=40335 RepID=A0A0W0ZXQ4_9GAMM|nr:hypothetical protein [Legionella tucsonensis]KTD73917.1 hypothetical protein Ltuc_1764 [Legionella tucsonensis]